MSNEAVYSLSNALDLVGVTHIHHGKRVAYIAAECGKQLGWKDQYLARFLGTLLELSEETCEMLELAGLLHDIGKLRVPDELLEKPGKLTEEEYAIVQRHSFDTYDILKNINGLEKITEWAAQHHERLDGKGYPFQVRNGTISLEARIVAVADVFQALAQNRPYRKALDVYAIMGILNQQVVSGQLDVTIVLCVENNLHACLRAAYCQ
ncbi:MAG: HD domain-containing protein [Methylococcaceae bacterium]|nr:HD domain-containing protein [Methylococcaceae bacterium]